MRRLLFMDATGGVGRMRRLMLTYGEGFTGTKSVFRAEPEILEPPGNGTG